MAIKDGVKLFEQSVRTDAKFERATAHNNRLAGTTYAQSLQKEFGALDPKQKLKALEFLVAHGRIPLAEQLLGLTHPGQNGSGAKGPTGTTGVTGTSGTSGAE